MASLRIKHVVKKELLHIKRDPLSLILLLFLPVFMLVLYGYALNFDVRHLSLAVVDLDGSQSSRELVSRITAGEYFDLKYQLSRESEIDRLFDREKIKIALVIPVNFERDLKAGRKTSVQVLVDGTNPTPAQTGLGYLSNMLMQYSARLNLELLERSGLGKISWPFELRSRVWYNPELKSSKFLVPGLMAFVLMVIIVLATSLTIVREIEKKTMDQLLLSPLRPFELVAGKIIPYLVLSLVGSGLLLLAGRILFGVSVRGNYLLLFLVVVVFLFCGLSQGLLISTVAGSQLVAFLLSGISTLLPTFILSGFVFPLRNMPPVIQAVSYLIPARYFLVCLRAIILKGVGLAAFYREMILMTVYGLVITFLSMVKLKKSLFR
ncbi:MAG: ABC transporter permease [Candidatus Saccharicenans sp.]